MCTKPVSDFDRFEAAKAKIDDGADVSGGLSEMIHLAFNAENTQLRRWAVRLLNVKMSVQVLEHDHAASLATNRV